LARIDEIKGEEGKLWSGREEKTGDTLVGR
jgi:hypothetical protein